MMHDGVPRLVALIASIILVFSSCTHQRIENPAVPNAAAEGDSGVATTDKSLAETAKRELFAIEHLTVRKVALESVVIDFDGVRFKLSDDRRKIVLLDFLGRLVRLL